MPADAITGAVIAAAIVAAAAVTLNRQFPRLVAWLERKDDR